MSEPEEPMPAVRHGVRPSPAQLARLERDRHARSNNRQPFPQRTYIGWRLPVGDDSADRAVAALTTLLRHHSQLGLLYGTGSDELGLARSGRDPEIVVVRRSEAEHTTAVAAQLEIPTSPGEAAATGVVCSTPSEILAGLVIDHLVCDSQSLIVLQEQFQALYCGTTAPQDLPGDRADRFTELQWEAVRAHRDTAVNHYRARTYEGLIASPLPLVGGSTEPNWTSIRYEGRLDDTAHQQLVKSGRMRTDFAVLLLAQVGDALHAATGQPDNGILFAVGNRTGEFRQTVGWLANSLPLRLTHCPDGPDLATKSRRIGTELHQIYPWRTLHISQVIDLVEQRDTPTWVQKPTSFVSIERRPAGQDQLVRHAVPKSSSYRGMSLWIEVDPDGTEFALAFGADVAMGARTAIVSTLTGFGWTVAHA